MQTAFPLSRPLLPRGAEPRVAHQGEQEEESGTRVRPAHDGGHCLAVDRVGGKEESGDQSRSRLALEQLTSKSGEDGTSDGMEDDVCNMISHWPQLMQVVIEAEGEDSDRPV